MTTFRANLMVDSQPRSWMDIEKLGGLLVRSIEVISAKRIGR